MAAAKQPAAVGSRQRQRASHGAFPFVTSANQLIAPHPASCKVLSQLSPVEAMELLSNAEFLAAMQKMG